MSNLRRQHLAILLLGAVVLTGCAATKTTSVTRNDNDSFCTQCPENGVPTTIKIQTHLKVGVYEQLYFSFDERLNELKSFTPPGGRHLKARTEQIETEKVIFVDVKRPAAGTLDYNLAFDSKGQKITQYESFAFDRTAEDTANLLAQLIPGVSPQADESSADPVANFAASEGTATDPKASKEFESSEPMLLDGKEVDTVLVRERVVAVKIFDINAPDFEQRVQSFLAQHMNDCNDCYGQNAIVN